VPVKGVALIGLVGVVIARVAIAHPQNPALTGELEVNAVPGVRDYPALGIQDGDGHHDSVLSISLEAGPVG
jgi:hypothetical protein